MKKFLHRLLLFLPVALTGYVLWLWLLGDLGWVRTAATRMGDEGHLNSRVKDIRNHHDVDILFLGSSHCYRTFDTRYYAAAGYRCFNLGSSNQTPIQTYVLLHQYLDSLNPKLIVFEVHPDIMRNDGVESAVNLLCNTPLTYEATRMAFSLNNMKVLNTWLYAVYNQKIRHRLEHFREDTLIGNYRYIAGGYCEVDTNEFVRRRYPRTAITIAPKQLEALKKCLWLLRERDIPYLLVEIQDAYQLRKSFTNHTWFEEQMSALGPYHYEILPMEDTIHFFNSNHLGQCGIELYNEHLLPYIAAHYLSTPSNPRSTSTYQPLRKSE